MGKDWGSYTVPSASIPPHFRCFPLVPTTSNRPFPCPPPPPQPLHKNTLFVHSRETPMTLSRSHKTHGIGHQVYGMVNITLWRRALCGHVPGRLKKSGEMGRNVRKEGYFCNGGYTHGKKRGGGMAMQQGAQVWPTTQGLLSLQRVWPMWCALRHAGRKPYLYYLCRSFWCLASILVLQAGWYEATSGQC